MREQSMAFRFRSWCARRSAYAARIFRLSCAPSWCMRMVRHPDLDRRAGDLLDAQDRLAGIGANGVRNLDLLFRILADQYVGSLEGCRKHPNAGESRRAFP